MLRVSTIKYLFSLHPYLKLNLEKLKLSPLTAMQQQALSQAENGNNIFINEKTGSGKTLCYLIPLLNNILKSKREDRAKPWGGLILTLTKQLGIQIYRQVRLLDPDNLIKISRIGSIAHFSGIVEKLNKKTETASNLDELVKENVVNTINWDNWDIVVSTPHSLIHAVNKNKNLLKPRMVVIDEADILLALDVNIAKITKEIIKKYIPSKQPTQFILAASSFPPKMVGQESSKGLNQLFPNIKTIESSTKHRLPSTLKVQFIDTTLFKEQTKDVVLLNILAPFLLSADKAKIIVFCNSSKTVEDISKLLTSKNVKNDSLSASLSTQSRAEVLSRFEKGQFNILVATNLASRGLDMNVDLVIEYDMATNVVDYLNRAGRTARFGKAGTLISFIEEGDKMLFENIKERLEKGEPMDEAFSRKRSLSKGMKKYEDIVDQL